MDSFFRTHLPFQRGSEHSASKPGHSPCTISQTWATMTGLALQDIRGPSRARVMLVRVMDFHHLNGSNFVSVPLNLYLTSSLKRRAWSSEPVKVRTKPKTLEIKGDALTRGWDPGEGKSIWSWGPLDYASSFFLISLRKSSCLCMVVHEGRSLVS